MEETVTAPPAATGRQAGADPYSIPLEQIDVSDSELFETDTLWGYFERLRQGRAGALLRRRARGRRIRALLVGDEATTTSSRSRRTPRPSPRARSIVVGDPDPEFPLAGRLHHHGRGRATTPTARWSSPSPRPATCKPPRAADPRARDRDPGRPPRGRDLRLGRPRLHRAHDRHAGDALRLPVGGATQAHLLVRHGHRQGRSRSAPIGVTEEERQEALKECLDVFTGLWKRARGQAGRGRAPSTSSRPRQQANGRGDARHRPHGVPRDPHPADRRRQRHHAELDLRRRRRAEREPGRVPEAAPDLRSSSRTW